LGKYFSREKQMGKQYELLVPTQTGSSMKIKTRIFTLVAFCLGLLTMIAGIGIWQMSKISVEIEGIAQRHIPLADALTKITVHQIKQVITFERAIRAGEKMKRHSGASGEFDETVIEFKKLIAKVDQKFDEVQAVAQSAVDTSTSEEEQQEYESVVSMLGWLSTKHLQYDRLTTQTLKLIDEGKIEQAFTQLPMIEKEEENLTRQIEQLLTNVGNFTKSAAREAEKQKSDAFILLMSLTVVAIVIGTFVAVFLVRRSIIRPLGEIVTGLDALSSGDMSVDVKVYNKDEIGAVARSYVTFKHSLMKLKQREHQLHHSEQRFRNIVEVSSDWIWECNEDLRFTYLSNRFQQATGFPKKELLGKTPEQISKDSIADWDTHLTNLKDKLPFRDFNYTVKSENGETRHWTISGRPVFDEDGNFKGYHGTGSDRTQEVRDQAELVNHRDHLQELVDSATQEIKGQAKELEESLAKEQKLNKLQREFVSMASHEFRTPLAIIDATAQRMKSRADKNKLTPEDAVERVQKIRGAVQRMTRLMESTLTAARMEEGKIDIAIEPCNIKQVIHEVCMRQQDLANNHIISCDLVDIPDTIQADFHALEQVFTNLLSNALKYSPDAPDIEVKGHADSHRVVLSVSDNGIGIDEDEIDQIGERFFRARTSTGTSGTGIGLNLVKTLVEMHGGSFNARSKKGEGSTFTICLPIAGPEEYPEAQTGLEQTKVA
jgi:PAS domain S-box-containing protein